MDIRRNLNFIRQIRDQQWPDNWTCTFFVLMMTHLRFFDEIIVNSKVCPQLALQLAFKKIILKTATWIFIHLVKMHHGVSSIHLFVLNMYMYATFFPVYTAGKLINILRVRRCLNINFVYTIQDLSHDIQSFKSVRWLLYYKLPLAKYFNLLIWSSAKLFISLVLLPRITTKQIFRIPPQNFKIQKASKCISSMMEMHIYLALSPHWE